MQFEGFGANDRPMGIHQPLGRHERGQFTDLGIGACRAKSRDDGPEIGGDLTDSVLRPFPRRHHESRRKRKRGRFIRAEHPCQHGEVFDRGGEETDTVDRRGQGREIVQAVSARIRR